MKIESRPARVRVGEIGDKAPALVSLGCGDAGQLAQCGEDVEQVAHRVGPPAFRHSRAGDHQRRPHRVVIEILLAKEAVAADRQAMVAGKDDERALVLAARPQRIEDAADLRVEERDRGVIVGEMLADDLGRPRPGRQSLVANGEGAVIERVLRLEVLRQRRQCRRYSDGGTPAGQRAGRAGG